MGHRASFGLIALMTLPLLTASLAGAQDASRYPDWKGQWYLVIIPGMDGQVVKFDPAKPWGRGQQAPLTPEYQAVYQANLAKAKAGSRVTAFVR